MSAANFVASPPTDTKWKVNNGHNSETHAFYLFLPNGAFFLSQINYVKIGFVTVIKHLVFSSHEGQTRITGGTCSNFNAKEMKMTSDVLCIERFEDGGLHVQMKPGSGAEGDFKLSPGEYQGKGMRLPADESSMQFTFSTPMKVTGKLKVPEFKDHEFDLEGTTGFFGHTSFKGRFDGGFSQATVAIFVSPDHKVIAITHQPRASKKGSAAPIRQVFHYHNGNLTCSDAELKIESTSVYSSTQQNVPTSLNVALTVDNAPATLSTSNLKPQQCIDALEQLPTMARKIIQNFIPNPCFYFHHHTGTITCGSTEIPGAIYVENDQF